MDRAANDLCPEFTDICINWRCNMDLWWLACLAQLFFGDYIIIWRERIASNRAGDQLSSALARRYQDGAKMLSSNNTVERLAGISLIRELGRESRSPGNRIPDYRDMCLTLLKQWAAYRQNLGISPSELLAVNEAIAYLQ